jgi:peptide/nickel transport system permease protein
VTVVFFLIQLAPGDPAQHLAMDPNIPPEARELQRQRLGLDQPLHVQYWLYMTSLLRGDLGVSFSLYPREVGTIILERMPRTVALLLFASVLAYGVGFVIGKWLAWRRNSGIEHATTVVAVFLYTVFQHRAALVMIWTGGCSSRPASP